MTGLMLKLILKIDANRWENMKVDTNEYTEIDKFSLKIFELSIQDFKEHAKLKGLK